MRLPPYLQRRLESAANLVFTSHTWHTSHFTHPLGEAALLSADSVSWRIFKNPIALLVGGVAAVILELAEPAVRTGVWEHSSFSKDPIGRLRRTGSAAMVTVYSARSVSEPMIAGVVRMHAKVTGRTPAGRAYSANDERLLSWVQATATFGIAEAYSRYVSRLNAAEFDAVYREGASASRLYGALSAPTSQVELRSLFDSMRGPARAVTHRLRVLEDHARNAGVSGSASLDATNPGACGGGDNPRLGAPVPWTHRVLRALFPGRIRRETPWESFEQHRSGRKPRGAIVPSARDIGLPTL